jgi:hypothetical protein
VDEAEGAWYDDEDDGESDDCIGKQCDVRGSLWNR